MTVGRLAITVGMVRNDRSRFVIARSKATWQSIFQVVQDESWIASPSARNDRGVGLAMTVGRLAMTPIYVIARSETTWQSIW